MILTLLTVAAIHSAGQPELLKWGRAQSQIEIYGDTTIILFSGRCHPDSDKGALALRVQRGKKDVKGCWFTDLGDVKIIWDNGKTNDFNLNQFDSLPRSEIKGVDL